MNWQSISFTTRDRPVLFQDDANHDPQWCEEQILAAEMKPAGRLIGPDELRILSRTTVWIFEILERAWTSLDCSLIDMKIEFGVNVKTG